MNLREYVFVQEVTNRDLAKLTGFSAGYISMVKIAKRKPGRHFIRAIEKVSGGLITEKDLMDFYNEKQEEFKKAPVAKSD